MMRVATRARKSCGRGGGFGCHPIAREHGAEGDRFIPCARIAHHPYAAHGQQHGESLPDAIIEALLAQASDENRVRPAQELGALRRHRAGNAHSEPRPRKGVAREEPVRQPEHLPERAHLVLEELAQRLYDAEIHPLRQPADIVVALDGARRPAMKRDRLDDIGVERPLGQELGPPAPRPGKPPRLLFKDLYERVADAAALLFRVRDPGKGRHEAFLGPGNDKGDLEVTGKELGDLFHLSLAEQAVVHEHAIQPLADRLMDEHGGHRRVDSAGEPAEHAPLARPRAHGDHGLLAEGAHVPIPLEPGDALGEVLQQGLAVGGVGDFGMELHAVEPPLLIRHGGDDLAALSDDRKPLRRL